MRQKQGVFSLFLLSPSSRRAWIEISTYRQKVQVIAVALLAEGVDRNPHLKLTTAPRLVALLAEGVDRNGSERPFSAGHGTVALLAEGVDRNVISAVTVATVGLSPSSRRAWIEIFTSALAMV